MSTIVGISPAPSRDPIRILIEELDGLVACGIVNPHHFQDPKSWFPILDAADDLEALKVTHGHLYRATRLGVKLCRERLMHDPDDLYSFRELDRVRERLASQL